MSGFEKPLIGNGAPWLSSCGKLCANIASGTSLS